ncbi:hypothetical protein I2486_16095 [Cellulophaga sp. E16_2]|uniref:hypothetical protein n=1 Tax=Cellulophaga sp. E16_2 TaxID=2789297 RepID=UPI001A91E21B|nr:hypothetical protein [Cellulophaga sp. E16_2]MBO0592926.1 hypothetical protein [Cellulophaga sp. E16_2]
MTEQSSETNNQEFSEPINIDFKDVENSNFRVNVPSYPILEHQFDLINNFNGGFSEWSRRLFLAVFWALIILLAKFIDYLIKRGEKDFVFEFKEYEIYSVCIALILCIICWFLSKIFKSKREKLVKVIKDYFFKKNYGN